MLPSDWFNSALPPRHIHFIGIGGIGMSALANLCLEKGWKVQGSNAGDGAALQKLRQQGAVIFTAHDARHLNESIHLVVASSAIQKDNPEIQAAETLNIPLLHRSALLKALIEGYKTIAVSGTHGKTTTTSLLGHVLLRGKKDPLIVAGGIMRECNSATYHGKGQWAVVEADESDKSHLNFHKLQGAIITNVEAEHLSNYGTYQNLLDSFVQFSTLSSGFTAACGEDEGVRQILPSLSSAISYGFSSRWDVCATRVRCEKEGMTFDVEGALGTWRDVQVRLWGDHNVLNTLAVMIAAHKAGVEPHEVRAALKSFPGIERRLTERGEIYGAKIIDDYAHHATEIKAVLKTLKAMGYQKILALCQPHRYTRLRDTMDLFLDSFHEAAHVVLLPVYASGEAPIPGVDSCAAAKALQKKGQQAEACEPWPLCHPFLLSLIHQGGYDVVACLGAGNITEVALALGSEAP